MSPDRESNRVNPLIVIFACTHNAGRSQMAASLFNKFAHPAKARAISASLRVTMGCGKKCPFAPGIQKFVRAIRDDIHRRVLILVSENNLA